MSNSSNSGTGSKAKKQAMKQFKMEAAREMGVNLSDGYNGNISAKDAGKVGGQMVKKMVEAYEKSAQ